MEDMLDVIIVGAGPARLSAALNWPRTVTSLHDGSVPFS
jgi:thioredoxin reductase